MTTLKGITSDGRQTFSFSPKDGGTVNAYLEFAGQVNYWYLSFTYGTIVMNGLRVCTGPNMLRSWRNILPFGLSIQTPDGQDPRTAAAFTDGGATFNILTSEEVAQAEAVLFTRE